MFAGFEIAMENRYCCGKMKYDETSIRFVKSASAPVVEAAGDSARAEPTP